MASAQELIIKNFKDDIKDPILKIKKFQGFDLKNPLAYIKYFNLSN